MKRYTFPYASAQSADLAFVRRLMKEPLLERAEEFKLARDWYKNRNPNALHKLIKPYLRLVVSMALRFRHYGLPFADLIQEGNLGLLQAADRFEPEREVRFSTYAKWWIRSSLQEFVLRNWSIVRTGTTTTQKILFFNLRRLRMQMTDITTEYMSTPERIKIATLLKIALTDVEEMENRLANHDLSLNTPLSEESEEKWVDFLPDYRPSPETDVFNRHDNAIRQEKIHKALTLLPARERQIIQARRLREPPLTLATLGKRLKISKERVRQLEKRAMGKMRLYFKNQQEIPGDLLIDDI